MDLLEHISNYTIDDKSSTDLSNAYKIANTKQENYRPNSTEHQTLEKFKHKLLKQIRSLRKQPTVEPTYEDTPES